MTRNWKFEVLAKNLRGFQNIGGFRLKYFSGKR